MHFPLLTVDSKNDPKGKTFTVHYVASIAAKGLLAPAGNGTTRPLLLAYAGSPSAVRAFTVNLRSGLAATLSTHHRHSPHRRFELLRSLGYRYQLVSPAPGEALALAYLPDLFDLQPGVQEHDALRFVSAPPARWLGRQEALLAPRFGTLARDHALAMAFVARLDARTPLPIANEPAFHHALFLEALDEPWVATGDRNGLVCEGLEALGLAPPTLCNVQQEAFAEFLRRITETHLPREVSAALRPAPQRIAGQLALDFLTA